MSTSYMPGTVLGVEENYIRVIFRSVFTPWDNPVRRQEGEGAP